MIHKTSSDSLRCLQQIFVVSCCFHLFPYYHEFPCVLSTCKAQTWMVSQLIRPRILRVECFAWKSHVCSMTLSGKLRKQMLQFHTFNLDQGPLQRQSSQMSDFQEARMQKSTRVPMCPEAHGMFAFFNGPLRKCPSWILGTQVYGGTCIRILWHSSKL